MGAYIEYAKGGTDFRTKGTISCWVKRAELGRQQYIWGWGENNSSDSYCRFDAADNLEMHCDGADGTFNTTRLFKDTNAWYHIVFSLDGANATANLRRRLWVNGVQVDEGKGAISTFSGAVMGWHSTQDLWIGANPRQQQASGHAYFNGLISHFHYCSNYSYAASDFGEFDSTTGEWKIITAPSVNYGSEGFFLKMEDSSNMDLDSSGNNKTLTTTGTVTATQDCPSNVFCVLNNLDSGWTGGRISLANGNNNTMNSSGAGDYGLRGTLAAKKGKYYMEFKTNNSGDGANTLAIAPTDLRLVQNITSGSPASGVYAIQRYNDSSTNIYNNGSFTSQNTAMWGGYLNNSDIISIALDLDNSKIFLAKNGVFKNTSGATGDPAAGTNPTFTGLDSNKFYTFYTELRLNQDNGTQCNFGNGYFGTTAVSSAGTNASGNGIFEYDVPAGFTALSTKGINSF